MSDSSLRWRLVLGADADPSLGRPALDPSAAAMDRALGALYGGDGKRSGDLSASSPHIARWLGDIRRYFPRGAVQMMQRDAVERLHLSKLLLEPELLAQIEPDVHLVANLLALSRTLPEATKDTARQVVREVVQDIEGRLRSKVSDAVRGAIDRRTRSRRPRAADIDWDRTLRRNLRNYLPEQGVLVPEVLVGHGRRAAGLHDIVLCVDQSGSMASSVVYASIFGAVLASLRSTRTHMVVFDTAVVDLTLELSDPVELLFGVQLGGGTDISRALGYCAGLVQRPEQTVMVLITDLYEGGDRDRMLARAAALVGSGVQLICLLALNDEGAPAFDHGNGAAFAALGVPTFACTPDHFPELIATAIERKDLAAWAARNDIALLRGA